MKEIFLKLMLATAILLIIILFLFLLVDCKMENTKLKLTVQNLHEENEELESEIRQLRESCNRLCLTLLNNRKITMQEISNLLPQKEVDFIKQEREKQLKHQ